MTFSRELSIYMSLYPEKTLDITYERDGNRYKTSITPEYSQSLAYQIGVRISQQCLIQSVVKKTPAYEAGIQKNDIIRSVDGQKINNGNELSQILATTKDKEVEILVERDGKELTLKITPKLTETESYYVGLSSYGQRVKTTPIKTLGYSFKEVGYWISTVFDSLRMMFTGKVTMDDIAGPVGVVNVMGQVVEESKSSGISSVMLSLLNIAVMISANLGVMNLLPIPALDGGRFVFLVIEAVRGKPVSREREGMVHFIGMVLLMLLMVFVMFNDIKNIFM